MNSRTGCFPEKTDLNSSFICPFDTWLGQFSFWIHFVTFEFDGYTSLIYIVYGGSHAGYCIKMGVLQRKKKERDELKGFGQLRQYANPALIAQEGDAFARAMDERFGKKGH